MKKHMILTGIATSTLIVLLAGCSSAAMEPVESADRQTAILTSSINKNEAAAALLPESIVKAGKLVIGVDPTYAPNEFKDKNGNPIGWEIDMIDAAAAALGLTTDYRVAKFDNIVPSILGEKYDLGLGGYYDTKKRQEKLDMVDFFRAGNQFVSPKASPITSEIDICGLKVAAQNGGSAVLVYLPELSVKCANAGKAPIEVLGYDTQDDATASVALGRTDAMVADSPVAGYAAKLSDGKLVASDVFGSILSGAPVLKERGTFATALQSALESLVSDGTYMEILEFWGVEGGAIDAILINGSTE